ncbi:unnamed protein product [Urochloa humidicola]
MPSGNGTTGTMVGGKDKGSNKRWRELHGSRSWDGLLDPLDLELRKSIISYGEMVQAAEDGFNAEERSPHLGACLYGYSDLLTATGAAAAAGRYEVTKFLYATSGVVTCPCPFDEGFVRTKVLDGWLDLHPESNFMGYVAVATDEGVAALGRRDIVVAWRGTVRCMEWKNDFICFQESAKPLLGSEADAAHPWAMVHAGFMSLYTATNEHSKFNSTSARDQVLEEVRRLMEVYKDEETSITITGHSLGAALSILSAVDIVANGLNHHPFGDSHLLRGPCSVTAIVFACPRVGNPAFSDAFGAFRDLRALHVRNEGDIVHELPPPSVPTLVRLEYAGVGVALDIHTDRSPFLRKQPTNTDKMQPDLLRRLQLLVEQIEWTVWRHNLECYLHGVAGEQGAAGGFKLEVDRDVALVNKYTDLLTEEHHVPANWWVAENKRMVKGADGYWKLKQDFEHV